MRTTHRSRRAIAWIMGLCALLLALPNQAAILTQTRSTASTVTPTGTWTNPNNAVSINGSCALGNGVNSSALMITGWGFSIPAGSTILGITVRSVSSFNDASTQDQVRLTKASVAVGNAKALNGPGSSSLISCGSPVGGSSGLTVGGASDLWGTTWTVADVNGAGFGVYYDNDFTNTAVDGVEISVTYDNGAGPTVTINKAAGQADPARSLPINFQVVFSSSVTGFIGADVSFTGSTASGALSATISGGPATYNVAVYGVAGSGNVVASIPAGVVIDSGGHPNSASTSSDNVVAFIKAAATSPQVMLLLD